MIINQSCKSLNDATVDLQLQVKSKTMSYNKNNELLVWSFSNASIVRNSFDEIKIDKKPGQQFKRIDPVDACIDAHTCKLKCRAEEVIDMYAIIKTGGKQYRVSEGDVVYIEKLDVQPEETVNFEEVIAVGKEDGMVIGAPVVEGAKVVAKVLKNGKGKKITVFTYRSKKDSKRKMGHRQPYTKVEIVSINA